MEQGLYESVVTDAISQWLENKDSDVHAFLDDLDPAESAEVLGDHFRSALVRSLHALPSEGRVAAQIDLINELLSVAHASDANLRVSSVAQRLREVRRGLMSSVTPRPLTRLDQSALLVNAPREPKLATELAAELESADQVDLLCAFVVWTGVRVLRGPLERLAERKVPLRVITTTYMGATEARALDLLVELGAEVRVSYETRATRLHAKAWLFERATGFSTAYIGSSNLSHSALHDGLEWNVRISQSSEPLLMDRFRAAFESYWQEERFEPYDPVRFRRAIKSIQGSGTIDYAMFDIRPYPYQERMLYELEVERERHGRWRNLVVAATGTGKTVLAALDYKRTAEKWKGARLLFVAHRKEILDQSRATFRHVLKDATFGEMYVAGHRPDEWQHVFASIQSLSKDVLERLPVDAFDVVIVDEFHHSAAPTYARLLDHLEPRLFLGLTATPERADGKDITHWFGGRTAVELRLWDAIDEGLLCPFQYFGVSDETDLSDLEWKRGGYDPGQLDAVYTGNDQRVAKVLAALERTVDDPSAMRALGFCVSVKHAVFMAERFSQAGIPSLAVSGTTDMDERETALRKLKAGEVNALFAVDLYNEGVDVPEIDTVMFLRPTESVTVFLQQLGRGLRKSGSKSGLTVLDFIGQQHRRFRFDVRFRALTGARRTELESQLENGFPFLPSGCHIELDRVAKEVVLNNLHEALGAKKSVLVSELKGLGDVSLGEFIEGTGVELLDIYRGGGSWSALRRKANLSTPPSGPEEEKLQRAMSRFLHIDDPGRISIYAKLLESISSLPTDTSSLRLMAMLHYSLWGKPMASLQDSLSLLHEHPAVVAELCEILALSDDFASHLTTDLDDNEIPLRVHSRYTRDEVLAALGQSTVEKASSLREGVRWDEQHQVDLFFVTLNKAEGDYSPTTMYKDYAISPELFHWESQSTTSAESKTGQRYINHEERGSRIFIFARKEKRSPVGTPPFLFLGPARYVSHTGSRPMAITWRLEKPMPPDFFQTARSVA